MRSATWSAGGCVPVGVQFPLFLLSSSRRRYACMCSLGRLGLGGGRPGVVRNGPRIMALSGVDVTSHLFSNAGPAETSGSMDDWIGPAAAWSCHCCTRTNDERATKCRTCGRSVAYGEYRKYYLPRSNKLVLLHGCRRCCLLTSPVVGVHGILMVWKCTYIQYSYIYHLYDTNF